MPIDLCTLLVGDRIASYCRDGLLEAEYVLFEPDDAVLSGVLGMGTRERGYETTALLARQRLRAAGLEATLADQAFAALDRRQLLRFSRVPSAPHVLERLTACEAFEGGEFRAASHAFLGTWLDLAALAATSPLLGVAQLLQILHLDRALAEVPDETPVRLVTFGVTAALAPGMRTWKRVRLDSARYLPSVLRALPNPLSGSADPPRQAGDQREALLVGLEARAAASESARPRLRALAAELTAASSGYTLPAIAQDFSPAVAEPVRAQPFSEQSSSKLFDELNELAKALRGEPEEPARPQTIDVGPAPASHAAAPVAPATRAEPVAQLLPAASAEPRVAVISRPTSRRTVSVAIAGEVARAVRAYPLQPWRLVPRRVAEIVETLSLPIGATEDMLARGARPRDGLQARIAMTRLARSVGRDYRLWYGSALQVDVGALESTQRHLRRAFRAGAAQFGEGGDLESECARHGALLSEILARALGAEWVDLSPEQPQDWAMQLPSEVRFCPIGRVKRYVEEGHRELDLIGFYHDLEARLQPPAVIL